MPDNLKILFHLTNIFNKELFKESLTAVMIANEIDQVQKDNPTLSNGIFSSPLTEKIQSSLAITFYDANMKTDKTLRKNLNQYIKHKEPEALSRISQYIHAKFKENTTEPYKTQVQKKINTTISPDNTPLNPNNRSRSRFCEVF